MDRLQTLYRTIERYSLTGRMRFGMGAFAGLRAGRDIAFFLFVFGYRRDSRYL